MANKTYLEQQQQLNNDLQKWNSFVSIVTNVVSQYQANVSTLQSQIDDLKSEVNGLRTLIDTIQNSSVIDGRIDTRTYITLSQTSVDVVNTLSIDDSKAASITVYSNAPTVYVTASKTIDGLTINGTDVTVGEFYTFVGSAGGDTLQIIANNVKKTDNVELTFATSGTSTTQITQTLTINIKYNQLSASDLTIADKPIATITDLTNRFTNAANSLNGLTVSSDIVNRLNASTNTSTGTISSQNAVNDLTKKLLGGTTTIGTVVKKTNQLS